MHKGQDQVNFVEVYPTSSFLIAFWENLFG